MLEQITYKLLRLKKELEADRKSVDGTWTTYADGMVDALEWVLT